MTAVGALVMFAAFVGFGFGLLLGTGWPVLSRIYETLSPWFDEYVSLKKQRLRDRYEEEKAIYKKASS